MSNQLRIFIAGIVAVPAAYGAVQLGLSLPINVVDATVTAAMFCLMAISSTLCWAARAYRLLGFGISVFVPANLLITALLLMKG